MVVLQSTFVSKRHATVGIEGGQFIVRDLKSANGTRVNGETATLTPLSPGDVIEVGDQMLTFVERGTPKPKQAAPQRRPRRRRPLDSRPRRSRSRRSPGAPRKDRRGRIIRRAESGRKDDAPGRRRIGVGKDEKGKARKQPYFIHRPDEEPLAMAGVWERWRGPDKDWDEPLHSVAVVTTEANRFMTSIHDRMPVFLPPSAWSRWLDPGVDDVAALQSLLVPAA